ncbi:MAG: hypothetical protein LUH23_04355 [Oscillospiraceae bacterium]|nr:hypothetical protein [Oscillospiraceae bacterium]
MGTNHARRNLILAVLSLIVLAVLGIMMYSYSANTSEQKARLEAAVAEAEAYENEVNELRRSISSAQAELLSDASGIAQFVVGFVISSEDDIAYAEEKADEYGFEPVLLLNCNYELGELESLSVLASGTGHEIMLTASVFTSDTNETVTSLLSYMRRNSIECSDIFLLRSDYYSDSSVEMLISDGFSGYTVYNTTPTSGITDDGYITFDYSFLTVDSSSYTRFSSSYSNLSAMIVAVDMDSMRSGTLTESFVTSLLSTLSSYAGNEDCEFATVSEVTETLLAEDEEYREKLAEYEAYVSECKQRIEELEELIAEIYSGAY